MVDIKLVRIYTSVIGILSYNHGCKCSYLILLILKNNKNQNYCSRLEEAKIQLNASKITIIIFLHVHGQEEMRYMEIDASFVMF